MNTKVLSIIAALLLCVGITPSRAQEVYAVLGADGETLTLRYDNRRVELDGVLPDPEGGFELYKSVAYDKITRIVLDESMKDARPTSVVQWFNGFSDLKCIDHLDRLNTSNVTDMSYMFYGDSKLVELDVSHFDISKVTDMTAMFYGCSELGKIYSTADWSKSTALENSSSMFGSCTKLVGSNNTAYSAGHVDVEYARLDGLDGKQGYFSKNVAEIYGVRERVQTLRIYYDDKRLERGGVTDWRIYSNSSEYENYETNNIHNVYFDKSMQNARPTSTSMWFANFKKLFAVGDMDYLNTSEVTDMGAMFFGCETLSSLDLSTFNTENVTDMSWMFYGCSSLKKLDVSSFDISKVTDMHRMFEGCTQLTTIYCNTDWSLSPTLNDSYAMFNECTNLVGGNDTEYDSEHVDVSYARPDVFFLGSGYFTAKTSSLPDNSVDGVMKQGKFSVASGKKVYFSHGNLQYWALDDQWRFAEWQGGSLGEANGKITDGDVYDWDWIDLFGWGTSSWNSGASAYLPYSTSTDASNYRPGGYNYYNLTGAHANADWGVLNSIINGGNKFGLWRTLSGSEWEYLLWQRPNAENLWGLAIVGTAQGYLIFPDDWVMPDGLEFVPQPEVNISKNRYTFDQWLLMEQAGAVFLPTTGYRTGKEYKSQYAEGEYSTWQLSCLYWSSSAVWGEDNASAVVFGGRNNENNGHVKPFDRSLGFAVRLVQDVDMPAHDAVPAPAATDGLMTEGQFSISADAAVQFSQGNLQFNAAQGQHQRADGTISHGTWKLADTQLDFVGTDNDNLAENYDGWIDLFGWGTSGFDNTANDPYAINFQPWASSDSSYYVSGMYEYNRTGYGPSYNMQDMHLVGTSANYDWGVYNAISNGGGQPGLWRVLSANEIRYLLQQRPNAELLHGLANVDGVKGLILLPDYWVLPQGVSFSPARTDTYSNKYTLSDWAKMQSAGAVFLPMAGYRYGVRTEERGLNSNGGYWTSTTWENDEEWHSYEFTFYFDGIDSRYESWRPTGNSVRLVQEVEKKPVAYTVINPKTMELTFYYDMEPYDRVGEVEMLSNKAHYTEYGDMVEKAIFDPSFADARLTSTVCLFSSTSRDGRLVNLESIEGMEYLNTSQVTTMASMFNGCSALTSIDLSNLNTDNVTSMKYMFRECAALNSLDLSKFNTKNVNSMSFMFADCSSLTELDLSNFNVENLQDSRKMFDGCSSLKTIYCNDDWSEGSHARTDNMFLDCTSLKGGNGTEYDAANTGIEYARPDGMSGQPGYFTETGPEIYGLLEDDETTLTLRYDNMRRKLGGVENWQVYSNDGMFAIDASRYHITKIILDETMKEAKPKSIHTWFANYKSLTDIVNLSYLNTSEVTDMSYSFILSTSLRKLDLSTFDIKNVTNMMGMFEFCSALESIYCNDDWSAKADLLHNGNVSSNDMFLGCTSLKGGEGTVYDANNTDMDYAHPDGGENDPGYFTSKEKEPELYIVISEDGKTLTIYYGEKDDDDDAKAARRASSEDADNFLTGNLSDEQRAGFTSVVIDESVKNARPTRTKDWFKNFTSLTEIVNLPYLNTENVETMESMFENCQVLPSIDLSGFKTGKVENMELMFADCKALTKLDLTGFELTHKFKFMRYMFLNCSSLKTIYCNDDWSENDEVESAKGTLTFYGMSFNTFAGCTSLKGGKGTVYSSENTGIEYARPDGGETAPGYFTNTSQANIHHVTIQLASSAAGDAITAGELWTLADIEINCELDDEGVNFVYFDGEQIYGTMKHGTSLYVSIYGILYTLDYWSDDSSAGSDRTFLVNDDLELTIFMRPVEVHINAVCDAEQGTVHIDGQTSFYYNKRDQWSATLTAAANNGWAFEGWVPELDWEGMGITPEQVLEGYNEVVAHGIEFGMLPEEVALIQSFFNPSLTLNGANFDLLSNYVGIDALGYMTFRAVFKPGEVTGLQNADADGSTTKPVKYIDPRTHTLRILMPDGRKFDANGRLIKK